MSLPIPMAAASSLLPAAATAAKKPTRARGIYVPTIVPFNKDGSINEGELRRIVSWLIEKGVHGLYPNGSTGEFVRLSFEERLRVVEIVAAENRGRVPIMAGVSDNDLDLVATAAKRFADLGCLAISVTGPYYFKVSADGVEAYFREVVRRCPGDILLYNIPQFANEIPLDVVKRLAQDFPRIIGIKDSSRDMPRFLNTLHAVQALRPDFAVFSGCEEILLPCLWMGGNGGTVATAGVVPELFVKLFDDFQAQRWDACKEMQFKLLDLIALLQKTGNFPQGFRAGVALRGFDPGPPRLPMTEKEQANLEEAKPQIAAMLKGLI